VCAPSRRLGRAGAAGARAAERGERPGEAGREGGRLYLRGERTGWGEVGRQAPRGINSQPRVTGAAVTGGAAPRRAGGAGRWARAGRRQEAEGAEPGRGAGHEGRGGGGGRPRGGGHQRSPRRALCVSLPSPRRLGVGGAARAGALRGAARLCFVSSSPCERLGLRGGPGSLRTPGQRRRRRGPATWRAGKSAGGRPRPAPGSQPSRAEPCRAVPGVAAAAAAASAPPPRACVVCSGRCVRRGFPEAVAVTPAGRWRGEGTEWPGQRSGPAEDGVTDPGGGMGHGRVYVSARVTSAGRGAVRLGSRAGRAGAGPEEARPGSGGQAGPGRPGRPGREGGRVAPLPSPAGLPAPLTCCGRRPAGTTGCPLPSFYSRSPLSGGRERGSGPRRVLKPNKTGLRPSLAGRRPPSGPRGPVSPGVPTRF
jgi:hypothetical protein